MKQDTVILLAVIAGAFLLFKPVQELSGEIVQSTNSIQNATGRVWNNPLNPFGSGFLKFGEYWQ